MALVRNLLFLCIATITILQVDDNTPNAYVNRSRLDKMIADALQAQAKGNDENQRNQNKNQGLINTLVNHNTQLKNIENKFEFIVNNFANTSHVKEIIERTNEIEKHVYGSPKPHKSWREAVLVLLIGGVLLILLVKIYKKYLLPLIEHYIRDINHNQNSTIRVQTISEQLNKQQRKKVATTEELAISSEQQLKTQIEEIHSLMNSISNNLKKINSLVRINDQPQ